MPDVTEQEMNDFVDYLREDETEGSKRVAKDIELLKYQRELKDANAWREFSSAIARGAMSYAPAFPGLKEIDSKYAKTCRKIMALARKQDVAPTDCIDEGCKINDISAGNLFEELDSKLNEW